MNIFWKKKIALQKMSEKFDSRQKISVKEIYEHRKNPQTIFSNFSEIWNHISELLNYPHSGKMRCDDELSLIIQLNNNGIGHAYFEDTLEILQCLNIELFHKATDNKMSFETIEHLISFIEINMYD